MFRRTMLYKYLINFIKPILFLTRKKKGGEGGKMVFDYEVLLFNLL